MAADVTLLSLPATIDNAERAAHAAGLAFFDDDEVIYDEDGEVLAVAPGETHDALTTALHDDPQLRWFEVGPISFAKALFAGDPYWLPGPTFGIHRALETPVVLTPALRAQAMVAMNVPDRSHYHDWGKPTSMRPWDGAGRPRGHRWVYRGRRRLAKRQHVRRWLDAQLGRLVWAESW